MKKMVMIMLLSIILIVFFVSSVWGIPLELVENPDEEEFSNLNSYYNVSQSVSSRVEIRHTLPNVGWKIQYRSSRICDSSEFQTLKKMENQNYYFDDFVVPNELTDSGIKISYKYAIYDDSLFRIDSVEYLEQHIVVTIAIFNPLDIIQTFDYKGIFQFGISSDFDVLPILLFPMLINFYGVSEEINFSIYQIQIGEMQTKGSVSFPLRYVSEYVGLNFFYSYSRIRKGFFVNNDGGSVEKFCYGSSSFSLLFSNNVGLGLLQFDSSSKSYFSKSFLYNSCSEFKKKLFPLSFDFLVTLKGFSSGFAPCPNGVSFDFGLYGFNCYSKETVSSTGNLGTSDYYRSCDIFDIPCHLGNAIVYLLYNFPLTAGIFSLFKTLYGVFDSVISFIGLFSGLGILFTVFIVFFILRLARWLTG